MSKKSRNANAIRENAIRGNSETLRYGVNTAETAARLRVNVLYRKLTELAASRFSWENLPDSVDARFLEMTLQKSGLAIWYPDPDYNGHLVLKGAPSGPLNPYDNAKAYTIIGANYRSRTVSARNCVPIWANFSRVADDEICMYYASRLSELDTTLDVNAINARRTRLIVADENTRTSAANINKQINSGAPVLTLNRGLEGMFQNVDLGVDPKMLEQLHIYRVRLWNECMSMLGIDSANQDKKERLVASEVGANDEQAYISRSAGLSSRQQAVDMINSRYSLDVRVSWNSRLPYIGKDGTPAEAGGETPTDSITDVGYDYE